jgi:hypothetical protein
VKDLFLKSGSADFQSPNKGERDLSIGSFILNWLVAKKVLATADCCYYQTHKYVESFVNANTAAPYIITQAKHLKGLNPIVQLLTVTGQLVEYTAYAASVTVQSNGDVYVYFPANGIDFKVVIL